MLISIAEYARKHGKSPVSARQKAARGGFKTAQKIGKTWVIDADEPYTDGRIVTGEYVNFRQKGRRNGKNI